MPRRRPPEIAFQDHIAAFLIREHGYGVLEPGEITDTHHAIAEDHLWAFLNDTQKGTLRTLADDYGTDARDEVFRALHDELKPERWPLAFVCSATSCSLPTASPSEVTTLVKSFGLPQGAPRRSVESFLHLH